MRERVPLAMAYGSLLLLTLIAAPNAQAVVVVDSDVYAGHTYFLLSPAFWLDTEAAAVTLGGHLVTIDDAAENDFVANRFGVFSAGRNLWIGLTDQDVEGTFVWTSGAPVVYTNWGPGEPNDCHLVNNVCTTEDYAHIMAFGIPADGQWNDLKSDLVEWYGVAEVDHVVPEPSTIALFSLGVAGVARRRRRRS